MKPTSSYVWLLMCFLYPIFSSSQEIDRMKNMVETDLQLRQKPGTEQLLSDYLSAIPSQTDTLYALIYCPNACTRCEAMIPAFFEGIKEQQGKDKETLLISFYDDENLAKKYNQDHGYTADFYLYDTHNVYKQIFSFNTVNLYGVGVLKICKSQGRLIIGGNPLHIDALFFEQLVARKEPMPQHVYQSGGVSDEQPFTARTPLCETLDAPYQDRWIDTQRGDISGVYGQPRYVGHDLFFSDELANGVYLFREQGKDSLRSCAFFQADSLERGHFIEIPDDLFQRLKEQQQVFHICLQPEAIDSGRIAISYSLPHLMPDTVGGRGGGSHVAALNSAAILFRNRLTGQSSPMLVPDFNVFHETYFYGHYSPFLFLDDRVLIECSKLTWPIEYEREEYESNPAMNPFADAFYDTENALFGVFDRRSGKLVERFGRLEECQRKSRTGYLYTYPIADAHNNEVAYTNGYTGRIYISPAGNLPNPTDSYTAFEIEVGRFPVPDSTHFYSLEYGKAYNRFFDRCIVNLQLTDDAIYCLVRYAEPLTGFHASDDYTVMRIDRTTHDRTEYRLPHVPGWNELGYGLQEKQGRISPFVILKHPQSRACKARVYHFT